MYQNWNGGHHHQAVAALLFLTHPWTRHLWLFFSPEGLYLPFPRCSINKKYQKALISAFDAILYFYAILEHCERWCFTTNGESRDELKIATLQQPDVDGLHFNFGTLYYSIFTPAKTTLFMSNLFALNYLFSKCNSTSYKYSKN